MELNGTGRSKLSNGGIFTKAVRRTLSTQEDSFTLLYATCTRLLRRIFGPKRNKTTGEWRKLHNDGLNDLYASPNIFRVIKSRRVKWSGHVARMGERRDVYRVLVGKPEGKRPLGRPWRRWDDNMKINLQDVGCGGMDCIELAQDREGWRTLVNVVMSPRVL